MSEVNEYLQKEVMRECWGVEPSHQIEYIGSGCWECVCGDSVDEQYEDGSSMESWKENHSDKPNRDFSTPTDYCALEDKMRELGEWGRFIIYLEEESLRMFYIAEQPQGRVELIADYWRQR